MKRLIEVEGIPDMTSLKDIRDSLDKLKIPGNYIHPSKYNEILDFLKLSRSFISYFSSLENGNEYDLIAKEIDKLFSDRVIEHDIESVISSDGEVRDDASPELRKIRKSIIGNRNLLRKMLTKILKNVSDQEYSMDDIITMRDGRSVIPVRVENKRKVPGIIHSTSGSGATVFIEPAETTEINNEITELQFKEQREIERILVELSARISEYYEQMKNNCEIFAEIDFLYAKSFYAMKTESSLPLINPDITRLRNAYHPLLVASKGKKNVVPLNIELNGTFNTLVITGPNAGGKTVVLKTLGLLQLMFQSALMIPASADSEMRIYKKIFVSIGDEQSIENDLSSFSSHLKSIKEITSEADADSLILIDEICSGTDPKFGSVLASAILSFLSGAGATSVVTTHISDLKSFAHNKDKFRNASLEYDTDNLMPTFRFLDGIPGQSFTFEIAEKFGFEEEIMNSAKSLLKKEDYSLENLIKELNITKNKYIELGRELELRKKEFEKLRDSYDKKISEIKSREKEIISESKKEAAKILEQGRILIEKTIKEIRDNKNLDIKSLKKQYAEETKALTYTAEKKKIVEEIQKGDIVKIIDTSAIGEVVNVSGKNIIVNSNGLIFSVRQSELEKTSTKSDAKSGRNVLHKKGITESAKTNLDIRGMFPGEIELILDNFIYEAHINSLNSITVVHGKGTGKLREKVQELLKKNNLVKSFRYGNWNEGDSGATIIELKS